MTFKVTFFSKSFLLACLLFTTALFSQMSNVISEIKTVQGKENEDLVVSGTLLQSVTVQRVLLYYKTMGSSEFKEAEMLLSGKSFEYTIEAADVTSPFIEYYIKVFTLDGKYESYPFGAPESNSPGRFTVEPLSAKDKEVIILSPEKNKMIGESEFFVSISLLRATENVKKPATKIFIDGVDITGSVLFADDMILFYADNYPQKFSFGRHELKVELYDFNNSLYYSTSSTFLLVSDYQAQEDMSKFTYSGSITGDSRNEKKSGVSKWFNSVDIGLQGNYKDWEINAKSYVSSEEKEYLQPVNRYTLGVKSSWLELNVGDHTPRFPSLIMSTKRVRGVSGALTAGFFSIQTTFGELDRAVEGKYSRLFRFNPVVDSIHYNYVSVNPAEYGGNDMAEVSQFGTYKRNVFAVRPAFGKGQNFQLGLTYLHSKDDEKSILFGKQPKENAVFGTDLLVGFFDQKILFTAQAAFSLNNTDISKPEMTEEEFNEFLRQTKTSDSSTMKDLRKFISKFITFNANLQPLNPEQLSTFASEAALGLNLSSISNYFKAGYIYRGNDYNSFGNNYLRTNVKGFNVMDRQRLFSNTLFLSASFERLNDNLQKVLEATNTFQTINASISYYPRMDLPGFLFSYTNNKNSNDLADTSISKYDDMTNRILVQVSHTFNLFRKQSVIIGFSTSDKDDRNMYNNFDAKNSQISLQTTTTWTDEFISNFNLMIQNSSINTSPTEKQELKYTSIALGGKYYMLQSKLMLSANFTPQFGDYKKIGVDISSRYQVLKNFSLEYYLYLILNAQIGNSKSYNDMTTGLQAIFTI